MIDCYCIVCGKENKSDSQVHKECLEKHQLCLNCHINRRKPSGNLCEECAVIEITKKESIVAYVLLPNLHHNAS